MQAAAHTKGGFGGVPQSVGKEFIGDAVVGDGKKAAVNELSIAKRIAAGELSSPQRYENISLFAMRVTGTGTAYRKALDEFVYRRPENYLTPEFLERCAGLAVIFEHPDKNTLNSQEFADRVVGSIMFAYIVKDEVWGIAKIYDDAAIEIMTSQPMSTSPAVVFRDPKVNDTIELDNGNVILIEGKPSLLDHLAICDRGVWDKGGDPTGVLNSTTGDIQMTEEELKAKAKADAEEKEKAEAKAKADAEAAAESPVMKALDAIAKRMDSIEAANKPAPELQTAADKAKADAEEEAKKKEEEEKSKADAQVKADAEIRAKIDAIQAALPKALSDADYAQMADCQAKADSVYSAFGDRAPAPLNGEAPLAYRKRLAAKLKEHSITLKAADLNAIADSATFDFVEKQIYSDAMTAAMNPVASAGMGLREVITRSRAGHEISTFIGKVSDFTNQFKTPVMKRAVKFNKPQVQ